MNTRVPLEAPTELRLPQQTADFSDSIKRQVAEVLGTELVDLDSILRLQQVAKVFGVSPNTVRNWVRDGYLSPPLAIGPRLIGWPRSRIEAHLRSLSERSEVAA